MKKRQEVIINIDLDDRDEYVNQYDDDRISDELHKYIIDEAMKVGSKVKIVIKIDMNFDVSEEEKEKLKKMLFRDFDDSINKGDVVVRRNRVRDVYLTFIGISCIFVSFLFNYLDIGLVSELFMIIGWVAVWEIVNDVLFEKTESKVRKRKYMQLKRATIIFE